MKTWSVAIDTGGTFTDFVARPDGGGALVEFKVASRPEDPARAVADGLEVLARDHGVPASALRRFVFGTTVATNALLERKGARIALVTTRGMRDVLEIQRQWRHRLFDLEIVRPAPLVPRRRRLEADERIDASGAVVRALTEAEAARVANAVAALDVEAVAVACLFSFVEPAHEQRIAEAIRARCPGLPVTLSSEVSPEFREYERTCTTAMNAYVMPAIDRLARSLEALVRAAGCPAPVRIMQSNGGLMGVERARSQPVRTLLSGPAGGVVGAAAAAAGHAGVVTMDMGGTSLDVSTIRAGRVELHSEGRLGGFPVRVPMVDIHTIGAGGGSIARLDRGAIKVGPESAGARPGPACYGHGGTRPTSTDCAVVAGFIAPTGFAGGVIVLDPQAARRAVEAEIAAPLGMRTEEAALAVIEVQVANMVTGIRAVTVERGIDPRELALLCFGGAGALYAGRIAEEIGMRTFIVPAHAGVLSALGLLQSRAKATRSTTRLIAGADAAADDIDGIFAALAEQVRGELAEDGVDAGAAVLERSCEMRYVGQAYEVRVPVADGAVAIEALVQGFHREHARLFGVSSPEEAVEIVGFHTVGEAGPAAAAIDAVPAGEPAAPGASRPAWFERGGAPVECPVYRRERLGVGQAIEGPAIIEEAGCTTVVYPRSRARVDTAGNLVVAVDPRPG